MSHLHNKVAQAMLDITLVISLIVLTLIALLLWIWYDSAKSREQAISICQQACKQRGWQLLDDTVACYSSKLCRLESGWLGFIRRYRFDYVDHFEKRQQHELRLLNADNFDIELPEPSNVIDLSAYRQYKLKH